MFAQAPSPILLEQRQREIVLVRHLRQHVADPGDGLALAADRRDLQRLRFGTPQATALPVTATDDELLDSLRILVDVWHARLVDRTPFGLMPRDRLAGLSQAQRAVGHLQSRGACQTLRTAAGVSQGVSDMIRAAECWTRTPTWPGWAAQSLEALDWAASLAAAERHCTALGTAVDAVRQIGARLSAGGLAGEVTTLAQRAESDQRRLRSQSLCK